MKIVSNFKGAQLFGGKYIYLGGCDYLFSLCLPGGYAYLGGYIYLEVYTMLFLKYNKKNCYHAKFANKTPHAFTVQSRKNSVSRGKTKSWSNEKKLLTKVVR